jgi:hypothetical protein
MGVFNCPDCGKSVSTSAPACPHCGRPSAPTTTAPVPATFPSGAPRPQVQMVPVLGCPLCGSEATSRHRTLYIVAAFLLFPIGLVCLLLPKIGKCTNPSCRHTFEPATRIRPW